MRVLVWQVTLDPRANNGAGMTPILLATRPSGQNADFVDSIRAVWTGPLRVVRSPLLGIVQLSVPAPDANSVILTSVNGVAAAEAMGLADGRTAWCVGTRTADAARTAGFSVITGPGDAAGLAAAIIAAAPTGRLAHIRGAHARGDVAMRLAEAGLECEDVVAYRQDAIDLSSEAAEALQSRVPVIVPLFSPRTGSILSSQGPFAAPLHLVMMSAAVAEAVTLENCASTRLAATPNAKAMTDAVLQSLRGVTAG